MSRVIVRFMRQDDGQDLIEYVLLASFVAAGVIAGATALGTNMNDWYDAIATWTTTQDGKF